LLEEHVRRAAEQLKLRERDRDDALGRARRARVLSKQAILNLHGDDHEAADSKLDEAGRLLEEIKGIVVVSPDLAGFEALEAAFQEFAEASILRALKRSGEFPGPEGLGVRVEDYLLGLGDVPGELRREALDALRTGDMGLAELRLGQMERIYLTLVSMEEMSLLRGLRRKLDIARGVIERTRGEITAEAGRRRLGDSIRRLEEMLRGGVGRHP
jgi:translin